MVKRNTNLLPGTLDILILNALDDGALHGYAISEAVHRATDEAFLVEEGTLYPALHRLEDRGWVEASWGVSENNRRAKFYKLTRSGRKHLKAEADNWQRYAAAVGRALAGSGSG